MAWSIGLEGCPRRVRGCLLGSWALSYGTTTRLLRADGVRAGLCACASESAAGPGSRGARPDATAPVLPSVPVFVVRMSDPDGGLDDGRVRFPRPRASTGTSSRHRRDPTETTTTILGRGFGIPLLDEPLEDLVHVHDLQRGDRNHDPGVLRDII